MKLPRLSGRECVTALQKAGFYISRQKGSHIIMRRDDPYAKAVIPNHREIDAGTPREIIREAEMSVEEFLELLD